MSSELDWLTTYANTTHTAGCRLSTIMPVIELHLHDLTSQNIRVLLNRFSQTNLPP